MKYQCLSCNKVWYTPAAAKICFDSHPCFTNQQQFKKYPDGYKDEDIYNGIRMNINTSRLNTVWDYNPARWKFHDRLPIFRPGGKIFQDDIGSQGHVGNCYVMAALNALACHPQGRELLREGVGFRHNGHIAVRLFKKTGNSFSETWVTFPKEKFWVHHSDSTVYWPIAYEMAIMKVYRGSWDDTSASMKEYDKEGGSPKTVFEALTGSKALFTKFSDHISSKNIYNIGCYAKYGRESTNTENGGRAKMAISVLFGGWTFVDFKLLTLDNKDFLSKLFSTDASLEANYDRIIIYILNMANTLPKDPFCKTQNYDEAKYKYWFFKDGVTTKPVKLPYILTIKQALKFLYRFDSSTANTTNLNINRTLMEESLKNYFTECDLSKKVPIIGSKGSGIYSPEQLEIWERIKEVLNDQRGVVFSTPETLSVNKNEEGYSACEQVYKGLAGNHSYAATGQVTIQNNNNHQVHFFKIINPWKNEYTRKYVWKKDVLGDELSCVDPYSPNGYLFEKDSYANFNRGEMLLELTDVCKIFSHFYVSGAY